jgi:hypothetical protein
LLLKLAKYFPQSSIDLSLLLDSKNNISGVTDKEYAAHVCNKMLAIRALRRADKSMYSHILHDMRNQYQLGNDCYPNNLTKAFDLLQNYHGPPSRSGNGNSSSVALQFAHTHETAPTETIVPGNNGKTYAKIRCSHCNKLGHYKDFCPDLHHKQHIMMGDIDLAADSGSDCESICAEFTFAHQFDTQNDGYHSRILLDSGSSCSVFCDKTLLTDIRHSDHSITAYTNGGTQESHYSGDFNGFFRVWYNPDCMLNILSWAEVASHFHITSDSAIADCIFVHISDGVRIRFTNLDDGIYLLDKSDMPKLKSFTSYSFANIVDDNKLDFTSRELEGADTARSLFKAMGFPVLLAFHLCY